VGNIAINVLGDGTNYGVRDNVVGAYGIGNTAVNLFGNNNNTSAGVPNHGALFSSAINLFGNNNQVRATPGPLAIAASIFQHVATVTKQGPGININGLTVGGAAAIGGAKTTTPKSAAAAHTGHSGR
jgi:hypothetical protein